MYVHIIRLTNYNKVSSNSETIKKGVRRKIKERHEVKPIIDERREVQILLKEDVTD